MGELRQTPKKSNLIYDVGLHHGEDTEYYLRKGFEVVAFEANPENAAYCRQKFAAAVENKKLTIVEGAIVENAEGKVKFYRNANHSLWGSVCEDWAQRNEVMGTTNEIIEVEAVDFAEALQKYGIPYYLKADILGAETVCLRALLEFENKPDYVSIRSEKVIFDRLEHEIELLEQLGYDKFQAVQQDVTAQQAPRSSKEGETIQYSFLEGASGVFGKDLPAKWKNRAAVLKDYERIFTLYWLFGDYSFPRQTESGRKWIARLERIFRRPLPGWYDTHAKHSSV